MTLSNFSQLAPLDMNPPSQHPTATLHARFGLRLQILLALLLGVCVSRSLAQDGNYFLDFTYASGANAGSVGWGFYHVDIDWTDPSKPTPTTFEMSFQDSGGHPLGHFGLADVTHFDGSGMFDGVFNTIGFGQFQGERFSLNGGVDAPDQSHFLPYQAVIDFPTGQTTYDIAVRFHPAVPEPAATLGLAGVALTFWAAARRSQRRRSTRS